MDNLFLDRNNAIGNQSLVSVIMNCFNGEKYLREAIDSVIKQTYSNWELIFWDNQSTDKSAEIIKGYGDSRLKYFYAPGHTVLYDARNHALEKTQGEYIAFLDVDDWWEPEKLEKQIKLFEDKEVGLVYGNFWLVNERKKKKRKAQYVNLLPEGNVLNKLLENYVIGMLTMVIRRDAIKSLDKVFDSRCQVIGDFDVAIRLAAKWKFACVQCPVASYRLHGNNISILDARRQRSEMEVWASEMQQHPTISTQPGLAVVLDNIGYMKILHSLIQGERSKAFSLFWQYPLNFKKIKLLFAMVVPLSILKALRA